MARPQAKLPLLALGLFSSFSLAASQSLPSSGLDCSAITNSAATPYRNLVATTIPTAASTLFIGPFPDNQDTQAYQQCCQKCSAANKKAAGTCTAYTVQVSMTQFSSAGTRVRYWCQMFSGKLERITVTSAPVITDRNSKVQFYSATFPASSTTSSSSSSSSPVAPWDPVTGNPCPFTPANKIQPGDSIDGPVITPLFDGVTPNNVVSKFAGGVAMGRLHVVYQGTSSLKSTRAGTTLLSCAEAACDALSNEQSGYFTWEVTGSCSIFGVGVCGAAQGQTNVGQPWEPLSDGSAFTGYLGQCISGN